MKTSLPHNCPEWDYLYIRPEDPEWISCICQQFECCEAKGLPICKLPMKEKIMKLLHSYFTSEVESCPLNAEAFCNVLISTLEDEGYIKSTVPSVSQP